MSTEQRLGKIQSVYVGHDDGRMGVHFIFGGDGWGVGESWWFWGTTTKWNKHCEWTEESRIKHYGDIMMRLSKTLVEAKCERVEDLRNKPVEVTIDRGLLLSWRLLTEVL